MVPEIRCGPYRLYQSIYTTFLEHLTATGAEWPQCNCAIPSSPPGWNGDTKILWALAPWCPTITSFRQAPGTSRGAQHLAKARSEGEGFDQPPSPISLAGASTWCSPFETLYLRAWNQHFWRKHSMLMLLQHMASWAYNWALLAINNTQWFTSAISKHPAW